MPSTHTASAASIALALIELDHVAGAAGLAYLGLLGLALVYLGEHYICDVAAGLALAVAVRAAEPAARPGARRISAAVQRISDLAWPSRNRLERLLS